MDKDAGPLRALSLILQGAGHDVKAVESGAAALRAVTAFRPNLVIGDLYTDHTHGVQLLGELHRRQPGLPVLIVSGSCTISGAVAVIRAGAFGLLVKPVDPTELLEHVNEALLLHGSADHDPDWRADIVTRNPIMEDLLWQANLVADANASVLITGPSGVGKELLARAIHNASLRYDRDFVALNSSAIPEHLMESELFGYEKGAFTGAMRSHKGLYQSADRGTLLLDEIGDMPLALQAKLLRVLEDGEVRPVGSTRGIPVDVRVISATHRDLETAMSEGMFREDLYYRLNVVKFSIPPLNERREDIPLLVGHFLKELAGRSGEPPKVYAPAAMERLVMADWPGNVRQLSNVVKQNVALSPTPLIGVRLVERALGGNAGMICPYAEARAEFTHSYFTQLLQITRGNVSQAARLAEHNRADLYKLLARHGIDPALFKDC